MAIDVRGEVFADDLTKLSPQEMEEQAEIFAEGSADLKEILLLLWSNGIQTQACCCGHEGKGMPYIAFYADHMTDSSLKRMLIDIFSDKSKKFGLEIRKGQKAKEKVFNENGEIKGEYLRERPISINIGLDPSKRFEENNILKIIKSALEKDKPAEYYEQRLSLLTDEEKEFVDDVITLKNADFTNFRLDIADDVHLPPGIKCAEYQLQRDHDGNFSYLNMIDKKRAYNPCEQMFFEYERMDIKSYDRETDNFVKHEPRKAKHESSFFVNGHTYLDYDMISAVVHAETYLYGLPESIELPFEKTDKFIVNDKREVVKISDDEIRERKLLSGCEYDDLIGELKEGKKSFDRLMKYYRLHEAKIKQANDSKRVFAGNVFVDDLTRLSPQKMEEQAEIFAEGSAVLKDMLVYLWKNGIQTIAGCTGHEGKGYPYLSLYIDKMTDATLRKILTEFSGQEFNAFMLSVKKDQVVPESLSLKDSEGNKVYKRPIHLVITYDRDKPFEINGCFDVLKGAIDKTKDVEYYEKIFAELSDKEKAFVEDVVTLKNTDFSKVKISETGVYDYIQKDAVCSYCNIDKSPVGISYDCGVQLDKEHNKKFEFDYEYPSESRRFDEKLGGFVYTPIIGKGRASVFVDSCYYTDLAKAQKYSKYGLPKNLPPDTFKGKYILDQTTGEVVELSDAEIEQRGILSEEEYKDLFYGKQIFDKIVDRFREQEAMQNNENDLQSESL